MRGKNPELSPHGKKVLKLLAKSAKPLTAYEILDKLRGAGIKAPPTVYRALEALAAKGLIHRIESLNAFVACHEHGRHAAQFAVCRACGKAAEICDAKLTSLIRALGKKLEFTVEREMLELLGLCRACAKKGL